MKPTAEEIITAKTWLERWGFNNRIGGDKEHARNCEVLVSYIAEMETHIVENLPHDKKS